MKQKSILLLTFIIIQQSSSATINEQEILQAFQSLPGISKELATIKEDKLAIQGIENERREIERLERQSQGSRSGRGGGRSIQASVGTGNRRERRGASSSFGGRSGGGGYRSSGSYYSPSRSYAGSSYQNSFGGSSAPSKMSGRQSTFNSGSGSSTGGTSSGSKSSKKSTGQDKKKEKKVVEPKETLAQKVITQLDTIDRTVQNYLKGTHDKIELITKENEIIYRLDQQGYITNACVLLQNYVTSLHQEETEKSDNAEEKKEIKQTEKKQKLDNSKPRVVQSLAKQLPRLIAIALNPKITGEKAQQIITSLKESSTSLFGSSEKIKQIFITEENKLFALIKEMSSPTLLALTEDQKEIFRGKIDAVINRIPLEWAQKSISDWQILKNKFAATLSAPARP